MAGAAPAQVLQRLDALVFHLHPDDLVTALVALLDVDTGHLQIARAGAPQPILAGPDDVGVTPVPARPPLGVGVDVDAPPFDLVLAAGASLVMFSDGLVERRDASLTEGIAHVLAAARANLTGDLTTLGEGLLEATPARGSGRHHLADRPPHRLTAVRPEHPEGRPAPPRRARPGVAAVAGSRG